MKPWIFILLTIAVLIVNIVSVFAISEYIRDCESRGLRGDLAVDLVVRVVTLATLVNCINWMMKTVP